MSLLGIIGKVASVAGATLLGGPAAGVAAAATVLSPTPGSNSPVNAGPIPPSVLPARRTSSGVKVLKNNLVQDVSPVLSAGLPGLPSPDSVVVRGSGTSIGPGGSLFATGSGSATAYFSSPGTAMTCGGGHPMRGTHLNKTTYRTLDGTLVPAGTRCVKNRRRNPLNPRALSRAVSRVAAAKKYATMLDRIEIKPRRARR